MSRSYRGRKFQTRWGVSTVTPEARFTREERLALLNRMVKRANRAAGYDTVKQPKTWEYADPAGAASTVEAHTRSEARALVKQALGIPKKRRLPKEVLVERRK